MSAVDLRVRPRGCWDPLKSKQVTVRYDSYRKLPGHMPSWRKPLSVRMFRGFSFATRGAAVRCFPVSLSWVSLCLTRTTEQHS